MPNKRVKKCNKNYAIRNTFCSKYPNRYFPYWKILFLSSIFLKLLLRNYVVDLVEICNVCVRKVIFEAAKRIQKYPNNNASDYCSDSRMSSPTAFSPLAC